MQARILKHWMTDAQQKLDFDSSGSMVFLN